MYQFGINGLKVVLQKATSAHSSDGTDNATEDSLAIYSYYSRDFWSFSRMPRGYAMAYSRASITTLPVYLGLILAEVLGNTILTHSIPTAKTFSFIFLKFWEYFIYMT